MRKSGTLILLNFLKSICVDYSSLLCWHPCIFWIGVIFKEQQELLGYLLKNQKLIYVIFFYWNLIYFVLTAPHNTCYRVELKDKSLFRTMKWVNLLHLNRGWKIWRKSIHLMDISCKNSNFYIVGDCFYLVCWSSQQLWSGCQNELLL